MRKISDVLAIKQSGNKVEINIEGVIGVPEWWQFDSEYDAISTKEKIKAEIRAIEELTNVSKIVVNIDSPGGSVSHAKAIYTALKNTKSEIFVNYTNDSASAATIIGAVAKKENVSIPDYVVLLIHEARIYYPQGGVKSQFLQDADQLEKTNKNIATIYSGQNNLSVSENLELIGQNDGEGELMTAERAEELGFAGNIQQTSKMAAFDLEKFKNLGYSKSQLNQLNNYKMGLFSKNKKNPLVLAVVEEVTYAHRGIAVDASFELVGSEELVAGDFEIEGQKFKVEASKIVSVEEIKKEVINYDADIDELKAALVTSEEEKVEMVEMIESQEERIDALEKNIAQIVGQSSKVKPPKNVIDANDDDTQVSAAAKSRERQKIKRKETIKNRGN